MLLTSGNISLKNTNQQSAVWKAQRVASLVNIYFRYH